MVAKLHSWVEKISTCFAVIAALGLLAIVAVVMLEVGMRQMGAVLIGGMEIVRVMFLLVIFFAFSHVVLKERDIRVDALSVILPPRYSKWLDILAAVISVIFFAVLCRFAIHELNRALTRDISMDGRLALPMWIPWSVMVAGSLMAAVASLAMALHYATRKPSAAHADGPSARSTQVS